MQPDVSYRLDPDSSSFVAMGKRKTNEFFIFIILMCVVISSAYLLNWPLSSLNTDRKPLARLEFNYQYSSTVTDVVPLIENFFYQKENLRQPRSLGFSLLVTPIYIAFYEKQPELFKLGFLCLIYFFIFLSLAIHYKITGNLFWTLLLLPYFSFISGSFFNHSAHSLFLLLLSLYLFWKDEKISAYLVILLLSLFRIEMFFIPAIFGYYEKKIWRGVLFLIIFLAIFSLSMYHAYGDPVAQISYNLTRVHPILFQLKDKIFLAFCILALILAPVVCRKDRVVFPICIVLSAIYLFYLGIKVPYVINRGITSDVFVVIRRFTLFPFSLALISLAFKYKTTNHSPT